MLLYILILTFKEILEEKIRKERKKFDAEKKIIIKSLEEKDLRVNIFIKII